MFVGFALLNTTHGKEAQTTRPATGSTNTEVGGNRQGNSAEVALIVWQFTRPFVHALTGELNGPSHSVYATQQEKDTPDLPGSADDLGLRPVSLGAGVPLAEKPWNKTTSNR
jgi:hypothetical protein